jgi:hypothetical protein
MLLSQMLNVSSLKRAIYLTEQILDFKLFLFTFLREVISKKAS